MVYRVRGVALMMDRTIKITADGGLMDAIDGDGAAPIEMMPGDSIIRDRVQRVLARDCARRRLLWLLLPAVNAEGRLKVIETIDGWKDPQVVEAGREILRFAGWPTEVTEQELRAQLLGPDDGRIT
jgi:hypothetical protein